MPSHSPSHMAYQAFSPTLSEVWLLLGVLSSTARVMKVLRSMNHWSLSLLLIVPLSFLSPGHILSLSFSYSLSLSFLLSSSLAPPLCPPLHPLCQPPVSWEWNASALVLDGFPGLFSSSSALPFPSSHLSSLSPFLDFVSLRVIMQWWRHINAKVKIFDPVLPKTTS